MAPLVFLPTSTFLAGFLCVLAWELELFALGVHFLAGKRVNMAGHVIVATVSAVLTVFAYSKGKRELAKMQALGARAAMTLPQTFLVVLTLLVFATLIMLFIEWQVG